MSEDPVPTVDDLLLRHLETAVLPTDAEELVLTTLGESPATPSAETPSDRPEPAPAYLTHIEVEGFRGIGDQATLELVPGAGLTIVAGRNGSGKSSFAEAAELALTGENQRWANRGPEWKQGWRNLHASGGRRIRVGLGLEGHRGGGTVECHWTDAADLDDRTTFFQRAGERRGSVAELGWEDALRLHRPFLSYAELGGLLNGRPIDRYDSLHSVLGLDRLSEVERRLKEVRGDSDRARKRAGEQLPALRQALAAHPDPRARQIEELLDVAPADVDLDQVEALAAESDQASGDTSTLRAVELLALPDRERVSALVEQVQDGLRRIAELAETPAARARALAELLQQALAYHRHDPDQPCPVCGGRQLDAQWAEQVNEQVGSLIRQAEQLDQADRDLRTALTDLRDLVPPMPALLRTEVAEIDLSGVRQTWQEWDDLLRNPAPEAIAAVALAQFDALAAPLAQVRGAAAQQLQARQQAWQPVAEQVRTWTETARATRQATTTYAAARKAVAWLRTVGERIRNDQLAPLAAEASEIWTMMRQDSNVDLGAIQLAGTGNRRKVDLNVAVDGEPGAALGVMSQGELHALALSLFLPRATFAGSPLRFLVIDDPVQSMDPTKVYGLARVLERVAASRQVIVFTHDDRLPNAIRHLGIRAHLRVVNRRERSQVTVTVDENGDPALRYLDDAWAVAKDEEVEPGVRTKVVSVLVRDALEAKCHDLVMMRGIRAGRPVSDLEEALGRATRLRQVLALALLDDVERAGEVDPFLRQLFPRGPQVVRDANRGAHHQGQSVAGPLTALVNDARELIKRMGAR